MFLSYCYFITHNGILYSVINIIKNKNIKPISP